MSRYLIITEKPSVAYKIANAISSRYKIHDGYIELKDFYVSWLLGHSFNLKGLDAYPYVGKYEPIIPDKFIYEINKENQKQTAIALMLANLTETKALIAATDSDGAGELVFRNFYREGGLRKPCYRILLSSLSYKGIRNSLDKIMPLKNTNSLFNEAKAKTLGDYVLGLNLSRLYSTKYRNELINYFSVNSVSISQNLMTALFIVDTRCNDVSKFSPSKLLTLNLADKKLVMDQVPDTNTTREVISSLNQNGLVVTSAVEDMQKVLGPLPYNLSALQQDAYLLYGLMPSQTLEIAQDLYEGGYISYPRTDARVYFPEDREEITSILYRSHFRHLIDPQKIELLTNNHDLGHTALHPTYLSSEAGFSLKTKEHLKVFNLIKDRVIEACMANPEILYTEHKFAVKGRRETFTSQEYWVRNKKESLISTSNNKKTNYYKTHSLPKFVPNKPVLYREGTTFSAYYIDNIQLVSSSNEVKLTLSELLGLLNAEKSPVTGVKYINKPVGGARSRGAMIEKLMDKNYIDINHQGEVSITELGSFLLKVVDERIYLPKHYEQWLTKLENIKYGYYDSKSYIEEMKTLTKEIFKSEKDK